MKAYWLEHLHTVKRPFIENGKRKISINNIVCIHPVCLCEGDFISAGDMSLSLHFKNRPATMKQFANYDIDTLYIGNLTHDDIEKKGNERKIYEDHDYDRAENDICVVEERTTYVEEYLADRFENMSYTMPSGSFIDIIYDAFNKFEYHISSQSTFIQIEEFVNLKCSQILRHPVKGKLTIYDMDGYGHLGYKMDDEYFESLETII